MANIKSAEKQRRQALKHRERNRAAVSRLRTEIKKTRAAIDAGDAEATREALRGAYSVIDRSARKGIIKGNTADRYKSRLSAAAKRAVAAS
ncbi:MAG TPA: 30S ribosomal protein S20 [Thermoanaerobaculia bacterium]|nr:30S ribosomal protein S20 [Thermoanaerobaculia bacterium]